MTEVTEAPPPVQPASITDKLSDFSDRLPPMLVKELRQGLRAKTFVIVFLTLQALLAMILLAAIGVSNSPQNAGHLISGIIFMFISIAILVIQPARAIGCLHREIKDNTIELIVLTQLSAWKIVLGKWISIVAQSALLVTAVIPYLILRYWFGDMNLFGEITLLGLIFIASAVFTAILVGVSSLPSVIIRGLIPLFILAWEIAIIPSLSFGYQFNSLVDTVSMQTSRDFWGVIFTVLSALYIGWNALALGASMIAPTAENHSTSRRLLTLVVLLLLFPLATLSDLQIDPLIALVVIIAGPAIVMALTEPITLLPPICLPFIKRGPAGVVAGRFLYPGWPSGVWFSALVVAFCTLILMFGTDRQPVHGETTFLVIALGTLLMPAVFMAFFEKRIRSRFTIYLLLLVASLVITMLLTFIINEMPRDERSFMWAFAWIPPVMFAMNEMHSAFHQGTVQDLALAVTACYALLLLVMTILPFRAVRKVERECIEQLSSES